MLSKLFCKNIQRVRSANEALRAIAGLKRSEFDEWTLFEVTNNHFPAFLKINSIEEIGERTAVRTKIFVAPRTPIAEKYPDAEYSEDLNVYDCKQWETALSESTIVSKTGQTLYHYKWADPQFLDLRIGIDGKARYDSTIRCET